VAAAEATHAFLGPPRGSVPRCQEGAPEGYLCAPTCTSNRQRVQELPVLLGLPRQTRHW
jgi:hypothetical protein